MLKKKENFKIFSNKIFEKNKNCCIEGRDISTKILLKSDIKFFLNVILILLRKEGIRAKKTNFKIKFQDVKSFDIKEFFR